MTPVSREVWPDHSLVLGLSLRVSLSLSQTEAILQFGGELGISRGYSPPHTTRYYMLRVHSVKDPSDHRVRGRKV